MKNLILGTTMILWFGGLSIDISAQSEKIVIGILPLTYESSSVNSQFVNSIQESLTNAFVKAKRFNIVDRSKMDALKQEKELQKSEDFMDGKVIAQGVSIGAQFLISGHVVSATATEAFYTDPETKRQVSSGFVAKLSISLKLIDVSTGQVVTAQTIEPKGGSMLAQLAGVAPATAEAAIAKAIADIGPKIDDFVAKNFPVNFSIVEIQEKNSKGNATIVLISGGSDFGLKKGQKLKVVEVIDLEVNGKTIQRKKEIGEIKITKVEDENFSVCSVGSGGMDISAKFEAKARILVITME